MIAGAFNIRYFIMKKTIKIKGKQHAIGGQLRAMMIWEEATGKPFELKMQSDYLLYFYCLLIAGDPDIDLGYLEFVDEMDADGSLMPQFVTAMSSAEKAQEIFGKAEVKGKKKD